MATNRKQFENVAMALYRHGVPQETPKADAIRDILTSGDADEVLQAIEFYFGGTVDAEAALADVCKAAGVFCEVA